MISVLTNPSNQNKSSSSSLNLEPKIESLVISAHMPCKSIDENYEVTLFELYTNLVLISSYKTNLNEKFI